jgi:glycosyltransferase involved in cell wall biosynthesis
MKSAAASSPGGADNLTLDGVVEVPASTTGDLTISFVMIAYNEAMRIKESLRAILELDDLEDFEIVVVDDGSCDTTCQIVQAVAAVDSHVLLLPLHVNSGRGAARAAGVDAAHGRYIAMIDADIILPRSWWTECRNAIPDYDAVSGIAVPDGDVVYLSDRIHLEPKAAPATTAVTGNNAVFKREVFEKVRYESDLRNGEDVALGYAMKNCGMETFVVPGLTVRHRENKTLFQAISWLFESGVGASRQFETYGEIRRPDQAAAVLVLLALNVFVPRPNGRRTSVGLFLLSLLSIATLHVRTKFIFRRNEPLRYAIGVATDALLVSAYVCGRVAGHGYVLRRSTR